MTARIRKSPQRSILKDPDGESKKDTRPGASKKVFFDEIHVQEYPIILGDNPAVSSGAPITIGWDSFNSQTVDLDFFEYCRTPDRRGRKKLILSVRRRAQCLLASGYSLEDIAMATLGAEETKKMRAESLRAAGWSDPWALLSGAAETTGMALKRADVLGVGAVVGAGAEATVKTGKMLVGGAINGGNTLVVKPVGKVVTGTGKVIGTGITTTGRAMGNVIQQLAVLFL
eukprot:CAMPEP_0176100856 /NCGR_PEP_ID=MMETSP0120_2-20121206/50586_1 /TAXON_ID=160619 /ORGANISM="Kryptoperidinium foliaceum, Strain CCMP 1326" /LENGTH=228 /DNA_ID=CAMNT_0017434905 /DNA_START=88 /DNA_END=774 /DNA_ORIENTATION=-